MYVQPIAPSVIPVVGHFHIFHTPSIIFFSFSHEHVFTSRDRARSSMDTTLETRVIVDKHSSRKPAKIAV